MQGSVPNFPLRPPITSAFGQYLAPDALRWRLAHPAKRFTGLVAALIVVTSVVFLVLKVNSGDPAQTDAHLGWAGSTLL